MEEAIQFIMEFYQVTRDVAIELYWDEIEAYMKLFGVKNERTIYCNLYRMWREPYYH